MGLNWPQQFCVTAECWCPPQCCPRYLDNLSLPQRGEPGLGAGGGRAHRALPHGHGDGARLVHGGLGQARTRQLICFLKILLNLYPDISIFIVKKNKEYLLKHVVLLLENQMYRVLLMDSVSENYSWWTFLCASFVINIGKTRINYFTLSLSHFFKVQ